MKNLCPETSKYITDIVLQHQEKTQRNITVIHRVFLAVHTFDVREVLSGITLPFFELEDILNQTATAIIERKRDYIKNISDNHSVMRVRRKWRRRRLWKFSCCWNERYNLTFWWKECPIFRMYTRKASTPHFTASSKDMMRLWKIS